MIQKDGALHGSRGAAGMGAAGIVRPGVLAETRRFRVRLDAGMTETLPGYDEIPYESFPIAETHPDRLAVIGRLFGLASPDPARARVLELGCAAGGNLLPIAWYLPETRCVGLELSRTQALRGAALAEALELRNVEIRHQDILDFPPDGEPFDYVIAHGVFSWVPTQVQEHVLRICGSRLAPGGIAFISYNTLPGGRQRSMLRDMLLHHARRHTRPRDRLAAARELLEFLATPLDSPPPGHDWLRAELDHLCGARDSYLYHEYLEDTNEPLLFADFVAWAQRHGLQYLADAQLHTMFPSTLGSAAEASLARFDDLVDEEQYADFLRLRPFRRSLLCRAGDGLTREVDLDGLLSLPLYTDLAPDMDGTFRNASGQAFEVDTPLLRTTVAGIARAFPAAMSLAELLAAPGQWSEPAGTRPTPRDIATLKHGLFNLLVSGGLHATLCPANTVAPGRPAIGPGPRATQLARSLALQGELLIPTPRHQALQLDPVSGRILALLDGSRDQTGIVEAVLAASARDGILAQALGGGRPERMRPAIHASLRQLLPLLARHGLLEAR
jgi:SAM-dependent methyltransferase